MGANQILMFDPEKCKTRSASRYTPQNTHRRRFYDTYAKHSRKKNVILYKF